MSKKKHNLIVISHPDDESIFFAGLMLSQRKKPWCVVCVTDGNADGMGHQRAEQFKKAARTLGAKRTVFFNLPDEYHSRLNQDLLKNKLAELELPHEVYTHGPIGEYGHPHHQDVSFAVHSFYYKKCQVYAAAHNCLPDKIVELSASEFSKKTKILSEIYFSETERFINFIPATSTEGFAKIKLSEVKNIFEYFAYNKKLNPNNLHKYKWFLPYFKSMNDKTKNRPF